MSELTEETVTDFTGAPEAPEAPEATTDETAAAETGEGEAAVAKGRPRDEATIARDNSVLEAVTAGPKTRDQIAADLEITGNLVYLSLWRLRNAGKVVKLNGKTWALPGTVLPEPEPKTKATEEPAVETEAPAES